MGYSGIRHRIRETKLKKGGLSKIPELLCVTSTFRCETLILVQTLIAEL